MPSVNQEGLGDAEAVENVVPDLSSLSQSASSATPAPRRRRGGRRVVRGAGAAGAAVALTVEDHSAPLFEEPRVPSLDDHDTERDDAPSSCPSRGSNRRRPLHADADADAAEETPASGAPARGDGDARDDEPVRRTRSRRRTPMRDQNDDDDARGDEAPRRSRRTRSVSRDESGDDRLLDTIDTLPEDRGAGHGSARGPRPMTSLLFQEPVLPAIGSRARDDRDDLDDRGRDAAADRDDRDARDDGGAHADRSDRSDRSDRAVRADRDADAERPSRRSRRRRGGGELVPVPAGDADERESRSDHDSRGSRDDADEAESGRSRRSRRLNAQERRAAAEVEQIEEDLEYDDITYAPITEEDLSEGPTRSRRRRRRSKSGDDSAEESPRRSRKQQYIDEITDIEGSTRLEAKKQRRRDNRRERSRQSQLMEQDFLARRENVERLMVVRQRGRHTQISVIEDNVLVEHYVSDIQEVATVGNVYLGRVQNVLPSMEAAFVDIGQARNGVLYAGEVNWDAARLDGQPRRIELAFKSGDPVLVQVTKDPIGHKGARLTSQVTLAGRFLVLVPSGGMTGVSRKLSDRERSRLKGIVSKIAPKDMGVIIRTAAEGASEEAIVKDLENLIRQWERITAKREEFLHGRRPKLLQGEPDVAIRVVRDIFNDDFKQMIVEGDNVYDRIEEYLETMAPDLRDKLVKWDPAEHEGKDVFDRWQIDSQLRKGMERQVYLPSGGSIVIDRTEAMTTIDVNTGRFIGKGKSLEETVTRCNLEAAEEIARQLRLRDIGGMVMIDFVDMVMPANRDLVLRRLVECLARDRTKHQVAEVTSLGLVQMTRKRIGQGLVEAFSEECPTCKGRGFILHDEPTVNAEYDDPYALKGGDPFIKTNKHGRGADVQVPQGSSAAVKAKLAQIAAAAVAANTGDE